MRILKETRAFALTFVFCFWITGCASKQDVSPLYKAAISNFEAARNLENKAITLQTDANTRQIKSLFATLQRLTLDQMQVLVITRWDSASHDFNAATRLESWRGLAGLDQNSELPSSELTWAAGALDRHLSKEFWTGVTGFDILIKPGGIDGFTGNAAPPAAQKAEIVKNYALWRGAFRDEILGRMPAIKTLQSTEKAILDSIKLENQRRLDRVSDAYSSLIQIAESAESYAGVLTDNAQIIGLANKILSAANKALGKAQTTTASED